jgi:hypothetical protein
VGGVGGFRRWLADTPDAELSTAARTFWVMALLSYGLLCDRALHELSSDAIGPPLLAAVLIVPVAAAALGAVIGRRRRGRALVLAALWLLGATAVIWLAGAAMLMIALSYRYPA